MSRNRGVFQSCVAFSDAALRNKEVQSQFAGNRTAMGKVAAAFRRGLTFKPGSTVIICFLEGSELDKQFVRSTVEKNFFNKDDDPHTCNLNLKIDWRNDRGDRPPSRGDVNQAHARIGFAANEGSYSYLGTEATEAPPPTKTMNLGWLDRENNGAVIIHEFGHFLGALIHEQQNPDAANTIEWDLPKVRELFGNAPNYWDEEKIRINIIDGVPKESVNGSAYDPLSIMHYYFDCDCFKNCQPEGLACSCGPASRCACPASAGPPTKLSEQDVKVLESIYPFGNPAPPDTTTTGPTTPDTDTDDDTDDENGTCCQNQWNTWTIVFLCVAILLLIGLAVLGYFYSTK